MSEINSFRDYTSNNSNIVFGVLFGNTSHAESVGTSNLMTDYESIIDEEV